MNDLRDKIFPSRKEAIEKVMCVPEFGCGKHIWDMNEEFKDEISKKEFFISGLCQECQDSVFGHNHLS